MTQQAETFAQRLQQLIVIVRDVSQDHIRIPIIQTLGKETLGMMMER